MSAENELVEQSVINIGKLNLIRILYFDEFREAVKGLRAAELLEFEYRLSKRRHNVRKLTDGEMFTEQWELELRS